MCHGDAEGGESEPAFGEWSFECDGGTEPAHMEAVYGEDAVRKVSEAKVLVVGAGGVGCELLKNLAVSGFERVTLIDLDTIDVSNLNRQFLFRREHVGETKARTAANAVMQMMKGKCRVEPIVGNIKESRFDVEFFSGFDVVLNALDNLDARRHVNRMCVTAKVPMVESGSTGYLGQVTVVFPKETECYDCRPMPTPKTFAVCTIRSTPEKPVHCITWAKQLLELLFGPEDESNLLADLAGGESSGGETGQSLRWDGTESSASFATRVVRRVFWEDVLKQKEIADEAFKSRPPPEPFDVPALSKPMEANGFDFAEQRVWTDEENASIVVNMLRKFVDDRRGELGTVTFDKDDNDMLAFVTSATNIRAKSYGVEQSSVFTVKGIAGNIVHAIATTNAVVASLIVLEALKVVTTKRADAAEKALTTYVKKFPSDGRSERILIQPEKLQPPNKACFVCSKGRLQLEINTAKATLDTLVDKVLRAQLGLINPSVDVTHGDYHNTIYESGEGLEPDEVELYSGNLRKSLSELRATSGAILEISDFSQNLNLSVSLLHKDVVDPDNPTSFLVKGSLGEATADEVADAQVSETAKATTGRKRHRSDDDVVAVKRHKTDEAPIVID